MVMPVTALYSGGAGTADDPYRIITENDILALSTDSANWDKYFIMTNDISLSAGCPMEPIGNWYTRFTGYFDGQGYTIRNFTMDRSSSDYVGFFGYLGSDAEIKNLRVKSGGVTGGTYVGVLAGYNDGGTISNCHATGSVTADNQYAGGLVGYTSGTITTCSATGDVTTRGYFFAGGLVGCHDSGTIECSYATGDATAGWSYAGGLVGYHKSGAIENCYATGNATGGMQYVGGLVGFHDGGFITNCYATGIATSGSDVGGLAGYSDSPIKNCYATGNPNGNSRIGGIFGGGLCAVINCYRHYNDGSNNFGIYVSDLTTFRDIAFLTSGTYNSGLDWSEGIISTEADLSKIWRAFQDKSQYPVFQWQQTGTGTIQISSTPAGASIFLNGVDTGRMTNATFSDVAMGEYTILIKKYEYTASQTITLSSDETANVTFTYPAGTLQVNSTPAGALISINGKNTGNYTNVTFSDYPAGTYHVTVELTGHIPSPESWDVTLAAGETETVEFTMVQLYSGGTGTAADPYLISTGNDIVALSTDSANWDKYFMMTNDISLAAGSPTETIGDGSTGFNGYFDGQGYTISDFTIKKCGFDYDSLFGYLGSGAVIRNLRVAAGADGIKGVNYAGVLAGYNGGSISNCSATGDVLVMDGDYGGVLVGYNSGTITACYATGNVNIYLGSFAGGLVGQNDGTIINCYATGNANAESCTGGFVGKNDGTIINCYATGNAEAGDDFVGGLVGQNDGPITNCYATGSADATFMYGGLVGGGQGSVTNCYRYFNDGDSGEGTYVSDISTFRDIAFLTGVPGLKWSPDIISTKADPSKVWRAFSDMSQYPIFQWQPCGLNSMPSSLTPPVTFTAPAGRLPANESAGFLVTVSGMDNVTNITFTISYDPALVTVENAAPTSRTEDAVFDATINNAGGVVTIAITDDIGLTAEYPTAVANITFRSSPAIDGLRQTAFLTVRDASAYATNESCTVVCEYGAIDVEARTSVDAPPGVLPVGSSNNQTIRAGGLNEVTQISFILEFNRTVMSVTDVRANATIPGLIVSSDVRNENGWLEVTAAAPEGITSKEVVALIDMQVHSNGLPSEGEIRLINPQWTRTNATYHFDDMRPGYITITPVATALNDTLPATVANMTFDDVTQEVAINLTENRNATVTDDNTTILVRNPGIDITIRTSGLENRSSEWTGECTGAEIGNISGSADLGGDVGNVSTGISADISGGLSALMNPDTGLDVTITRGAVNETMGRLFQLGVSEDLGAELEEVAYTMEINKSAFGDITVADAVIVMSAPASYVNAWGGADSFTVLSLSSDGTVSHLATTYTYADGIYTFTALSPDGFSFKALVAVSPTEGPVAAFAATPVAGDAPLMVQFYDYSEGRPTSRSWDFGDGMTSTEQNPVHIYTATGAYDVSLTVTNVVGEDTTDEVGYITVANPMTVDFTATPLTGYAPLTVTFTDETTSSPTAWLWDFGDGQTSTVQNPMHTYERAGAYTVSLTATNAYGMKTAEKERFVMVSYHTSGGDDDDPVPVITQTPTVTPTPVPTTVPTTVPPTGMPTGEPTQVISPTPAVINPNEFIETARLSVRPDGATESPVTIWSDVITGYLHIGAGVTARDASGVLQENISIVAVPVTSVLSPAVFDAIDNPAALYAYDCTPDGVTFSPAITLTFTLSEDEWSRYGGQAEVAWFNSMTGEWEVIAGTADAGERTITITVDHFSTYALFGDDVAEVPLPDVTKPPAGSSDNPFPWIWMLIGAVIVVGGVLFASRRKEDGR